MINKLKRKIAYWLLAEDSVPAEVGRNNRMLESDYMRIDIYRGTGGVAVETMVYNKKQDVNHIGFYIVHEHESLGQELSKIITVESIKAL